MVKRSGIRRVLPYFAVMFVAAILLLLLSYCMEQNSAILDRPGAAAAVSYAEVEQE